MTTTKLNHRACDHANTKADRAACRRRQEAFRASMRAENPGYVGSAPIMTDSLGVAIVIGDRIVLNAWGGSIRLVDVKTEGTVTGFARSRVIVRWDREQNGPIGNVRPDFIAVLRRDGAAGLQGNVNR